jgi:hypothetical protein
LFKHAGKTHVVKIVETKYTEDIIVTKLRLWDVTHWLIFQNGGWRFVSDVRLSQSLQIKLVSMVLNWHKNELSAKTLV